MIPQTDDTRAMLVRLVRRWPWILLAGILGGVLGLLFSRLTAPVYEAVAVVGVGVDPARGLPADDETLRLANDRVREVFLADETLQAVREQAADDFDSAMALRGTLRLSEVGGGWELGVRNASPDLAATLANAWSRVSVQALQTAAVHAWMAAELQAQWYIVGCRLIPLPAQPELAAWECAERPEAYDPDEALTEIQTEAVLSRGVLPSMSFSALQQAEPPSAPLTTSRALLTIAGCLVGLLAGSVLALAWPERKASVAA